MATDYGEVGRAFVRLFADRRGLQADLDKAEGDVAKALEKIGGRFQTAGKIWSAALTAPIVAAVGVAVASLNELDKANQRIVTGTGAIGAKLKQIKQDFVAVLGQANGSVSDVASAITQLYQRTGQTGEGLQSLANQILNISDVAGEDGVAMIGALTQMFANWNIETSQQSAALDTLYTAYQKTGTALSRLSELATQFGAPLRAMGYSFVESIALLAQFEKEGVNTERVMSAVNIATSQLVQAGIRDLPSAFSTMISSIQDAKSMSEGAALAIQFFGAKAGPDMAAAIREGAFGIDQLVSSLTSGKASINESADATQTFTGFLENLKNKIVAAFSPLEAEFAKMDQSIKPTTDALTAGMANLIEKFGGLPQPVKNAALGFTAFLASVGPVLLTLGPLSSTIADAPGAWKLLAPILGTVAAAFGVVAIAVLAVVGVIGTLRGVWMLFGRDIIRITNGLVSGTVDGFNAIAREAANFSSGFLRGFAALWSAVGSIFETGVKAAAGAITWLYDQYNKVVNAVAGWIAGVEIPKDLQNGQAGFFNEMKAGINAVVETSKGIDFVTGRLEDNTAAQKDANSEGAKGADEAARHAMSLDDLTAALDRNKEGADKAKAAAEKLRKEREAMAKAEQDLMDAETKRMRQEMETDFGNALQIREQAMPGFGIVEQLEKAMELAARFPAVITPEVKALLSGQMFQNFYATWAEASQKVKESGDPVALMFTQIAGQVETLISELGLLDPVIKDAQEKVKKSAEKSKMSETWGNVAVAVGKVGGALSSLPGKVGQVGRVMSSVAQLSQAALAAIGGGWMEIIDLIVAAIQVLGIFGGKNKEEAKGMAKIMEDLGDAVDDWGKQLTDVLVEFVKTGKASFKDLADSIISDILRITIQAAIVEPLIKFGKSALGFAKGGVFSEGKVYKAAVGAVVTRRTGFVGPMGLGIAGEGGGHGEGILPLAEVGGVLGVNASGIGGGDGDTYITVNNNTSAQVKSNSFTDTNGAKRIVFDIVNEGIATGAFDRSGGGAYNWQRKGFGG